MQYSKYSILHDFLPDSRSKLQHLVDGIILRIFQLYNVKLLIN